MSLSSDNRSNKDKHDGSKDNNDGDDKLNLGGINIGDSIVDKSSNKKIGSVVTPPDSATQANVAIIQLRLDDVLSGYDGSGDNSLVVINDQDFRCLPYIPIWWPKIDLETGKAEKVEKVLEEDI